MPGPEFCPLPVCCFCRVPGCSAVDPEIKREGECQRAVVRKKKKNHSLPPSCSLSCVAWLQHTPFKHFSESHKDLLPFIPSNDTCPFNLSRLCPLPSARDTCDLTESLETLQSIQTTEWQNKTKMKNASQALHSWTLNKGLPFDFHITNYLCIMSKQSVIKMLSVHNRKSL